MPDLVEQHVTSLVMSDRLAEAGVERNSLFYWLRTRDRWEVWHRPSGRFFTSWKRFPAYTASELGAMLPQRLVLEGNACAPTTTQILPDEWEASYTHVSIEHESYWVDYMPCTAHTEADARAALLLELIDAKHIKPIMIS